MTVDPFKPGNSSHAEVREEQHLPRADVPEIRDEPQAADAYEVWRTGEALATYGGVVPRFIESCFGTETVGRGFAAELWTDFSFREPGFLFGPIDRQRSIHSQDFAVSPDIAGLLAPARLGHNATGVLIHYRPARAHLLDFFGTPLEPEMALSIESFATERLRRWAELSRVSAFARSRSSVRSVFEGPLEELVLSPVHVFLSAPSPILFAAGLAPGQTHHRSPTTAGASSSRFPHLGQVLAKALAEAGGEIIIALTSLPATWQAPPMSRRDVPPHITPRQSAETGETSLDKLALPADWKPVVERMQELHESGILPTSEQLLLIHQYLAGVTGERAPVTTQPESVRSLGQPAYMQDLRELAQRVAVREARSDDKRTLLSVLRKARHDEPEDNKLFVDMVNGVLEGLGVRLRLSDGALAWLRTTPGQSGRGFMAFQLIGSGKSRGWLKDRIVALQEAETTT